MSHKHHQQVKIKNAGALYAMLGIVAVTLTILGLILLGGSPSAPAPSVSDSSVVTIKGDVQYVDITAKAGGYYPKVINAKAGVKTVLRFKTERAYGCETAMTIPSLNIKKNLPPTGVTEIEIGNGQAGKDLLITCLMRMYSATVKFTS